LNEIKESDRNEKVLSKQASVHERRNDAHRSRVNVSEPLLKSNATSKRK
jgi:hypothetical protein